MYIYPAYRHHDHLYPRCNCWWKELWLMDICKGFLHLVMMYNESCNVLIWIQWSTSSGWYMFFESIETQWKIVKKVIFVQRILSNNFIYDLNSITYISHIRSVVPSTMVKSLRTRLRTVHSAWPILDSRFCGSCVTFSPSVTHFQFLIMTFHPR